MDDIFNKFTKNARLVLTEAQRIAQNENEPISTEILLLALIEIPRTLSHDILKEYSVNLDQIKLVIDFSDIKHRNTRGKITKNAKDVLKTAFKYAADFKHYNVDCEHILIALLSDESFGSYKAIRRIGIDPEQIKRQLLNIFKDLNEMDQMIKEQKMPKPPTPLSEIENKDNPQGFGSQFAKPQMGPMPSGQANKKKVIEYFGTNLVDRAKKKKIDPVWGRDKEIKRCIQILLRKTKNNPVFIGEPGVGKTAIVEGLAQKIANDDVPDKLKNKKIYQLDLGLMVAGTMYRGQFEERLKKVIAEVKKDKNIILFIDEVHSIIGTGSAEGSLDAANILKPSLAKGEIRMIGATTFDEYRKHLEKDAALERRLQAIKVDEPSVSETIEILKDLRKVYEKHHELKISNSAITAAANLSNRYLTNRFLPDKAIDLIDEASSSKVIDILSDKGNSKASSIKNDLEDLIVKKEKLISQEKFEEAAKIRDTELKLRKKERDLLKKDSQLTKSEELTDTDIAKLVSEITGIPVGELAQKETKKYLNLENELSKYIAGQEKAIKDVSNALRRNRSGLSRDNKPIGSFIFLGPSGVGKTELARVLARKIYLSEDALVKIDMSEFMERHNLSRLVGAPPGYVGFDEAGKLTETVKKNPYSIILFDEIEKAHPDIFNILLQIMDEGKLTDAKGKMVDFTNTIIIMTSNIGIESYRKISKIGFDLDDETTLKSDKFKSSIKEDLFDHFKPEFINRIDKIVVFDPLEKKQLKKIAEIQLEYLRKKLKSKGIKLKYTKKIISNLIEGIDDKSFGARPLIRKIADAIENRISDLIISNNETKEIRLSVKNGKIQAKST